VLGRQVRGAKCSEVGDSYEQRVSESSCELPPCETPPRRSLLGGDGHADVGAARSGGFCWWRCSC
jgi:hypothetical protein